MSLRAAGIRAFGGEVELLDLPDPPSLRGGEVLIDVRAAGVANWDEFVRTGQWDVGGAPPLALGVEAAGEVVAIGGAVDSSPVGAAVMTHPLLLPYQGCWAQRLVAPAHLVAEKTENASWRRPRRCPSRR
jgi:NADPH:quinone reductase-like Zn-dependent oxidoreductase